MTEITGTRNEVPEASGGHPRRRALLALAALALAASAFGLGWALRPPEDPNAASYGRSRTGVVRAHLDQVHAPYVLLAGDSYMELFLPERLPCGRDVVDAGVSGAKAGETLLLLGKLRLEPRPAAALLSVGLNHLLAKGKPGRPDAVEAFRHDVEALIARLAGGGTHLVVIAIPPLPATGGAIFDTPSIARYGDILRAACARSGCTFVDPFAAARDPDASWRARPGVPTDNLHLTNLRQYYRPLYAELCR